MTGDQEAIIGRLAGIEQQLAEVKTALVGNATMGHRGIVDRLEVLELHNAEVPATHTELEARAHAARALIHVRIDELEERTNARLDAVATEWTKFKAFTIGVAVGAGVFGGSVGAYLVTAFGG